MDILKEREQIPSIEGRNRTDVLEKIFHVGDVIKVRIDNVNEESSRVEMSMFPMSTSDDDEESSDDSHDDDEEFVDEDSDDEQIDSIDEEVDTNQFNVESVLLWWKGSPYVPSADLQPAENVDLVKEVMHESAEVVDGTWRRMFEVDLQEDADDFSTKVLEEEVKELEEEIGELKEMDDSFFSAAKEEEQVMDHLAGYITPEKLSSEWLDRLEFVKESRSVRVEYNSKVRAKKTREHAEFAQLLSELESSTGTAGMDIAGMEAAALNPRVLEAMDANVEEEVNA